VRSKDASQFLRVESAKVTNDEEWCTYMLVEVLGDARYVEVRVALVRKLLELRVE
jgi:hypothetical protein